MNRENNHFDVVADLQSNQFEVLSGLSMARWKVEKNSVTYCNTEAHTLSIYLCGGETSYRADRSYLKGAPGKICLMPKGQDSNWHINGDIQFMHLYFSDEVVNHYASTALETDVRFIELKDLLYKDDSELKWLITEYIKLTDKQYICSPLFAEQAAHKILHHLLCHHNGFVLKERRIVGGLSPIHMQHIRDYINDKLDKKLTIERLSKHINMSPFHFARMFKISFGVSPASYITWQRVERVKSLLITNTPLAEISTLVGFSQQSHMTNSFKKKVGLTPSVFRDRLI